MRLKERISLAIGATALLTSVVVIGGALRWAQATVAVLVALALIAQLASRRKLDRASPLLWLIGVAIVLTAVQLIPLPSGVISALDPVGAGLRRDGAIIAGTSPWPCLSMDCAGTLRALAFFITLFGVAVLSLRFAGSERGRYYLLAGVAITCGIAAGIAGVHTLLGASSLYGVYEPSHAAPPILGPLLNANHFGCLMALGAILAAGLAFYEQQAHELRVLWVVTALGCSLALFGTQSRGAALGLVLGLGAAGLSLIGSRLGARHQTSRQRRSSLASDLPMAIVLGTALAVSIYASAGNVADQIDRTSLNDVDHPLSKFQAWKSSFKLVGESPWIGVGRGATEPTLTRVHPASAYATFSHLENEYVSAIVEWGVPAALLLAVLLGWAIVTALRRWRDGPLVAAAIGGVTCVMFQSSVDFGVEMLGLAVPATIVASTLLTVPLHTASGRGVRVRRALLVVATFASAIAVLLPQARSLQEDHDAISASPDPAIADLKSSIERHPLDYFGFAKLAEHMSVTGDHDAAHVLNHALVLHPSLPGLHRLAARFLLGSGRTDQAALEYAEAMSGTLDPKPLLGEILTMLPDAAQAAAAIPPDWEPEDRIDAALNELKRPDVLLKWLQRVIALPQVDIPRIDELYYLAVARADLDAAAAAAERRLEIAHTYTSRVMLARIHAKRGQLEPIISELADVAKWHDRIDEQGEAWLMLCDAYIGLERVDTAVECLHKLDSTGMMFSKRAELTKRLKDLDERRAFELKLKALQDAGHSP